ncbi:MAG: protein kinase, partial [Verrucomicrobia bacterium]|nr:protein kinase [Verrucomicrobiota bacterium]
SVLYLGIHPTTSKPIVIKVLSPKYCKNKEMASRFLKEAAIIGMAHHPNIVRLYGQGAWEKGLYIAMEFVQGISLRQFIQQKSLTHQRALEIILQVAYALCHLHTHGVIHRDLKPENILITESGEIKVIDFGIAHLQGEAGTERITQKRKVMGTPVYMSPEQKENPSQVSFASDLYSLGILAYELILGKLSHGVIRLDLLPTRLQQIIGKALQENPKDRYADIVDLIADLSGSLQTIREETFPKPPQWAQVEIGLAVQADACPYVDFLHLSHNRYAIVLAEPSPPMKAATLRGMMRLALRVDHAPAKVLGHVNQALCNDPIRMQFKICLLVLDPDKDRLCFVSCKSTEILHILEGSLASRTLTTPNEALGSDATMNFLDTSDNWRAGDRLILNFHAKDETWLREQLILPVQPLADKLMAHTPASAIISLHRVY